MLKLICPHCDSPLKFQGNAERPESVPPFLGIPCRCPQCKKVLYSLDIDDVNIMEYFPLLQWTPIDDGRSSADHVRLAKCGINGTAYFRPDDPIFDGWLKARRRGERPCRCITITTIKYVAEEQRIPIIFAKPINFDPWALNDCELLGGHIAPPPWKDDDYKNHPGNPIVKYPA